jgi:hypothetical protein
MDAYPYMDALKANEAELRSEIERLKLSTDPLELQSVTLKQTHLRNIQSEIRKHTPIPPIISEPTPVTPILSPSDSKSQKSHIKKKTKTK